MYFLVVHVHGLHPAYKTVHLQSQENDACVLQSWSQGFTPIGKPAWNVVFHIVSMNRCYSLGVQNF